MEGSVSVLGLVSKVRKFHTNKVLMNTVSVYDLNNHVKYSICKNSIYKCTYAKNSQFGWNKCNDDEILKLSRGRMILADESTGREILLDSTGLREVVLNSSDVAAGVCEVIQNTDRQIAFSGMSSNCFWLFACSLMRSINNELDGAMIICFLGDRTKYHWLSLFSKAKRRETNSLHTFLRLAPVMNLECCRYKSIIWKYLPSNIDKTDPNETEYFEKKNGGLMIVVLEDTCSGFGTLLFCSFLVHVHQNNISKFNTTYVELVTNK